MLNQRVSRRAVQLRARFRSKRSPAERLGNWRDAPRHLPLLCRAHVCVDVTAKRTDKRRPLAVHRHLPENQIKTVNVAPNVSRLAPINFRRHISRSSATHTSFRLQYTEAKTTRLTAGDQRSVVSSAALDCCFRCCRKPKVGNLQYLLRDEDIGWLDVSVAFHAASIRVLHSFSRRLPWAIFFRPLRASVCFIPARTVSSPRRRERCE